MQRGVRNSGGEWVRLVDADGDAKRVGELSRVQHLWHALSDVSRIVTAATCGGQTTCEGIAVVGVIM